jgi:hypothetical protein
MVAHVSPFCLAPAVSVPHDRMAVAVGQMLEAR